MVNPERQYLISNRFDEFRRRIKSLWPDRSGSVTPPVIPDVTTEIPLGQEVAIQKRTLGTQEEDVDLEAKVVSIRNYVEEADLPYFLNWASHLETREHLDPAPIIPSDPKNPIEVVKAVSDLRDYYSSENIVSFVAVNIYNCPVGVVTARFKKDPYIKDIEKNRTGVMERLMVNPELRSQGIGTMLAISTIDYLFHTYKGFQYEDAEKKVPKQGSALTIYTWIMEKGNWYKENYPFFRRLKFRVLGHWDEEARKIGTEVKADAMLLGLKHKWWDELVKEAKVHVPTLNSFGEEPYKKVI